MATAIEEVTLPKLSNDEIARYSRHLLLPELKAAGQRRIKAALVLCIGAGTVEIQRNFIGSQVLRGATSTSAGWRNPLG